MISAWLTPSCGCAPFRLLSITATGLFFSYSGSIGSPVRGFVPTGTSGAGSGSGTGSGAGCGSSTGSGSMTGAAGSSFFPHPARETIIAAARSIARNRFFIGPPPFVLWSTS